VTNLKSAFKSVLLLVASLIFALLMGEVMVRFVYEPQSEDLPGLQLLTSRYYQRDYTLGWVPRANVQGTHIRQKGYTSTFTTNFLGLRDREHSLENPEGSRRVVVVGDSFSWGWGVNDGEIFTDILEKSLADTEVINLGVTAYGLDQEIAYFKQLGVQFGPDILVVAFCQNDVFDDGSLMEVASNFGDGFDTAGSESEKNVGIDYGFFLALKKALTDNSALYGLVVDAVNSNRSVVKFLVWLGVKDSLAGFDEMDVNIMPSLKNYPVELAASWESVKAKLRGLNDYTSEHGIRLVIALIPALQSVELQHLERSLTYSEFELSDFDVDKPYDMLVQFGKEEGIEVINPVQAFREATESGESLYLRSDLHFNVSGHALFASEIAAILNESWN
jgi:lysophospholipase L1-like esterase